MSEPHPASATEHVRGDTPRLLVEHVTKTYVTHSLGPLTARNGSWKSTLVTIIAPVLLLLALAACGGDPDEVPVPFTGMDGAALYAQACASCHGADLRGTAQGPPFLHDVYRPAHHADAAFLLAVRRGSPAHHWRFGSMPPVVGLSDEQVQAITAFVRERQRAAGIE